MPKRIRDYEEDIVERLKNPAFAVEYLNAALEDGDDGSDERFLIALRHVAKASGMTVVAQKSGMARQAMYRTLSESGNPELTTLKSLLDAMGLQLAIKKKKKAS